MLHATGVSTITIPTIAMHAARATMKSTCMSTGSGLYARAQPAPTSVPPAHPPQPTANPAHRGPGQEPPHATASTVTTIQGLPLAQAVLISAVHVCPPQPTASHAPHRQGRVRLHATASADTTIRGLPLVQPAPTSVPPAQLPQPTANPAHRGPGRALHRVVASMATLTLDPALVQVAPISAVRV